MTSDSTTFAGSRVLVIDDDEVILEACRAILQRRGLRVVVERDARRGLEQAVGGPFDLVLLDVRMPGLGGMEILAAIRQRRSDLEVIMITGHASVQAAVNAVKLGAFDYLPKPFTPDELMTAVRQALGSLRRRQPYPGLDMTVWGGWVSVSETMAAVQALVTRVAPSDATILVTGETGTGKELVASVLHGASSRRDGPFVSVDCSALAPGLLESELFGHVKGSFSGAVSAKPGLFEIADGGTLFLDEVCNLTLETQGKLLRFLESGEFRPVGGVETKRVSFRLVAATNRDLSPMVAAQTFRQDLFYRLNVVPVHLPPLRERRSDIPVLVQHFLRLFARDDHKERRMAPEALEHLLRYNWPGNVRELKNLIERLVVVVEEETLRAAHLPDHILRPAAGPEPTAPRNNQELKARKRAMRERVYEQLERAFVLAALQRNGWNVSLAARETGLLRPNFHALMRKHSVRAGDDDGS